MNNRNYQRELDALITGFEKENKVPRLFLHSCCAPCSSYVLEYLSKYFEITVFFYNPNISPKEEYEKRVEEIRRMIGEMNFIHPVKLVEQRFTEWPIFLLISRKKTATSVPLSCPENIICTVRITVAVYFQKETEMNKYAKNILFI